MLARDGDSGKRPIRVSRACQVGPAPASVATRSDPESALARGLASACCPLDGGQMAVVGLATPIDGRGGSRCESDAVPPLGPGSGPRDSHYRIRAGKAEGSDDP